MLVHPRFKWLSFAPIRTTCSPRESRAPAAPARCAQRGGVAFTDLERFAPDPSLYPADPDAGGCRERRGLGRKRSAAGSAAVDPLTGKIATDDPRADDVRALLERHLAFANRHTPPEDVHALDVDALLDPAVTFFSYRLSGELLGVAALKRLDRHLAELKSMHTAQSARGRGIGRAMVDHLLGVARERGFRRVSLETGAGPAFAPARSLYAGAGFRPSGPFGDYLPSPNSTFMTLSLSGPTSARDGEDGDSTPGQDR